VLGEDVFEGTVTGWLTRPGDRVEAGEPLVAISTDKVDFEMPSPVAGVLTDILVRAGETVEVGTRLAVITGQTGKADIEAVAPGAANPADQASPVRGRSGGSASVTQPAAFIAYMLGAAFFFQSHSGFVSRLFSVAVFVGSGVLLADLVWARWLKARMSRKG
jgi:pyruvate/2-oxoglutarate dehydrogenase complex dihydrolipoamide acyltransferase (E2) component